MEVEEPQRSPQLELRRANARGCWREGAVHNVKCSVGVVRWHRHRVRWPHDLTLPRSDLLCRSCGGRGDRLV